MAVKEAIDILKRKNCRHEDKKTAYASLLSTLKSDAICEEELKTQGTVLLKCICRDLLDTDEKIIISALHVLYVYFESEHIGSVQKSDSELALKSLLQCGHKTQSVDVIKSIFDILSVQKFHSDVLSNEITGLLDFIDAMNSVVKTQSVPVMDKLVKIFVRLEEQIGQSLRPLSPRWARLIFPGLVNLSEDVREMTLSLLEKFRMNLCDSQDLSRHVIKALNAGLAKSLKGLMRTHEVYVLRAWPLIVQVTGKELHKGSTINSLLEIIEIGFKGSHLAKHNAFIAWRSLIDNFNLDKALLVDPKRIKLLLMVLKVDIAKVENVTVEKLKTWWHFCSCLGAKLAGNFEMVLYPLLHCCAGNDKLHFAPDLAQSSRLALKTSTANSPQTSASAKSNLPVFPSVQKLGCEVIAHLISKVGKSEDPGKVSWELDPLSDEVMGSPAVFVKHAPVILSTLQTLLVNIGSDIEETLILHIWISLGNHLKAAMDSSVKTECRDIFSAYLTILHLMVQNQILQTQTIVKMIQICSSFPQKVLASTAYNITGGQTVRGCPAQLLNEVLLNPYVMKDVGARENFIKLFSTLTNAGASNLQGALLFLQVVAEMLDSQALSLGASELLWKMWSTLAHTLQETINTTNEVNQGDALEYNFGCMYAVLLLPVKHQLSSKMSQVFCKVLLKTWKELYYSFARLSALVATAEANSCLEEMCAKIIQNWNPEYQDPVNLEFLSSLCHKMIECVDFSAISVSQSPGGGLTLSPSKWVRRRQRPLGNLHSFVHLLATLQTELNLVLSKMEDAGIIKKQDTNGSVILVAHTLIVVYTKLFTHITTGSIISNCLAILASPLARLYQPSIKSGSVKLFVLSFLAKLEKLWQEIAQCITGRYNGQYDSEFLGYLSPLLEVTFLHNRRTIKNQTLTLWNTTFGRTQTLEYPSSLKSTLIKMKEKNTIILPGLILTDHADVVAETPFSEMSLGDSQVPAPALLASPKRQKGSLLNRDLSPAGKLSPKPKASPAKVFSPKKGQNLFSGSRKKIDLDLLPKEDFVVIESPITKKKRLLTEHQKEIRKQKCVLPAMYNNIDTSQDISQMSQFGTETQQSVSSADVIIINSSESQEHTNEPLLNTTKCLKDYEENDSATSETSQHHSMASISSRRSVRIQELQSSNTDEIVDFEMQSSLESDALVNEINLNRNTDDSKRDISTNAEKSMSKQNCESLVRPLSSDSCETNVEYSRSHDNSKHNTTHLDDQKNHDAPFVMFNAQMGGKINLSQNSICTKMPKGNSLRKVKSQDDIPCEKLSEEMQPSKGHSPQKIKAPRRVPLKKINEQECEPESEISKQRIPSEEKICSSGLDCWVALSKVSDTNKFEKPTEYSKSNSQAEHVESDSELNVSCTLVEDTQSPFKIKQDVKGTDHSIAETPHKSESSSSPPVRATSARKLFADGNTSSDKKPQAESEQIVGSAAEIDSIKNKEHLFDNSEIPSSQGFEIANDLNILTTENVLDSSDCKKRCAEVDICASDMCSVTKPESETLFPDTQISISSLDMMMPTLSSPLGHLHNISPSSSLNSSVCENKTSASSSSISNKQSCSSELDFICSEATLADEVLTSRNKRKRGTPKRLLQAKCKRSSKRHSKVKKGCHCCKSTTDHSKFESVSGDISTEVQQISFSIRDISGLIPDDSVSAEDSELAFAKVKISDRALKEMGEVTPDIKSPRSNPERRHSTVKKMGRQQKRKMENSDLSKSFASKKIKIESSDKSDNACEVEQTSRGSEGRKYKFKPVSQDKKRKSIQPSHSRLGKHKQLLKTRNKTIQHLTSDSQHTFSKKRRIKLSRNDLGDDEDMLPLSSYLKKFKKDDSGSTSKDDHDDKDTGDKSPSESNCVPVEAVENVQTLNARSNIISVKIEPKSCSEENLLIIDAALETALKRILSETCMAKNKKEIIVSDCADTNTTGKCSSVLSENIEIMSSDCVGKTTTGECTSVLSENIEIMSSDCVGKTTTGECTSVLSEKMDLMSSECVDKTTTGECSSVLSEKMDLVSSECVDKTTTGECTSVLSENIEIMSSECVDKTTTGECISVLSEDTDISPDHLQSGQHTISPNGESQEPDSVNNLSELGYSAYNSKENVDKTALPKNLKKSSSTVLPDCQEDVNANNSECNGVDDLVKVEISQNEIEDTNLNSENIETEKVHLNLDEDASEQQTNSKACLNELDPHLREKILCFGENVLETELHTESEGSSEKCEQVVYDWSPTKSPSCSILKKITETPPLGKNRRVCFAEPVVSGESPVREHKEFTSTSPLISAHVSSPGQRASIFNSPQGRISKYRRRLESSRKQELGWSHIARKIVSPQTQTQLSYKPTQESQLNNGGPIFPELIDCTNPLDDILPQLTSSLWCRGLSQLMKGRSLNTIGDLCSLTEVQIDQLPIRHPKVNTVKSTLNAYMAQHGLAKSACSYDEIQDGSKITRSKGSTMEQEVTPASIDHEGIQVHPNADKDLKHLSPIRDPELDPPFLSSSPYYMNQVGSNTFAAVENSNAGDLILHEENTSKVLLRLNDQQCSDSNLKKISTIELFDIFLTLNSLSTKVVEELKSRQPSFLKE